MKKLLYILILLAGRTLLASPPPPSPINLSIDEWGNISLEFETVEKRRYIIEKSIDLISWETHHVSPFKPQAGTKSVMGLGQPGNTSNQNFYRVSVSPGEYYTITKNENWLGDLSTAQAPNGDIFLAFQDRDNNELFVVDISDPDNIGIPERVAFTGVEDDPSYWDNSGYAYVVLKFAPNGAPYIVCTDDESMEVICLWKDTSTGSWLRQRIAATDIWGWSFTKFDISESGILGTTYRSVDGSYFSWATYNSPRQWQHIKLSENKPSGANNTALVFNGLGDALAQCAGNWRINIDSQSVTNFYLSAQIQTVRSEQNSLVAVRRQSRGLFIFRSEDHGESWSSYCYLNRDPDSFSVNFSTNGFLNVVMNRGAYVEIARAQAYEASSDQWIFNRISGYEGEYHCNHLVMPDDKVLTPLREVYEGINLYIEK